MTERLSTSKTPLPVPYPNCEKFFAILVLFLLTLLSIAVVNSWRRGPVHQRAAFLPMGATKHQVERRLGKPDAAFPPSIFTPMETWAYRGNLKFERIGGSDFV